MPKVSGAVAGCITLGVVLAAVLVVLAVFLVYNSACIGRIKRTHAPASFAHAYIVHGTHRTDRAAHVAALARIANHAVHGVSRTSKTKTKTQTRAQNHTLDNGSGDEKDEKVHVLPATFPARDARAQADYANCGSVVAAADVVKPGEFGCSTSHMRLLKHALRASPALAEPRTTQWVLVFEDDAQLLPATSSPSPSPSPSPTPTPTHVRPDPDAIARASAVMREAIARATVLGVNAVFFGWFFWSDNHIGKTTRIAPQIWRVDAAPVRTHAYALRGAIAPAVLHMLRQRRCHVPVDSLLRRTLPSSLLVTRSSHIHRIHVGRSDDALFGQAGLGSDTR